MRIMHVNRDCLIKVTGIYSYKSLAGASSAVSSWSFQFYLPPTHTNVYTLNTLSSHKDGHFAQARWSEWPHYSWVEFLSPAGVAVTGHGLSNGRSDFNLLIKKSWLTLSGWGWGAIILQREEGGDFELLLAWQGRHFDTCLLSPNG